jgi:membrane fusion protein, copper/silver efflux system
MTIQSAPLRTPLTVLATAIVLVAILFTQHLRHGWPFSLHHGLGTTVSAATHTPSDTRGTAAHEGHQRAVLNLTSREQQAIGIRLDTVRAERMFRDVRAVATVIPDESTISHVHTRVAGWVEALSVNTTGEFVKAGQPIARIFSQELLSSQTEYLTARRQATSGLQSAVVESGRTRLKVLGMTDAEIAEMDARGEPMRLVTLVAPRSGIVVHRGVSVGTAVDPSTELVTVADLSRVWVIAEVPEADIPSIELGASATLDVPASGRPPFSARVSFIYPTLSERTRTLRVRFDIANPRGVLRPGLFGTAMFQAEDRRMLTVPRDAVVDTGREQHLFVVAASGRFEPRVVTVGIRRDERVEIQSGVTEGESIVASGVFLLDSESRLRASGGMSTHAHGGSPKGSAQQTSPPEPARQPAAEQTDHASHAGHKD